VESIHQGARYASQRIQEQGLDHLRTDETGKYKRQWVLRNAWGQKIDMEEFDGMSSEPVIEKLTVACDQVDFKNL